MRYDILPLFTAADAPWQHGDHEERHKRIRQMVQATWETTLSKCKEQKFPAPPLQFVLDQVGWAINETVQTSGVSSNMWWFGRPTRSLPGAPDKDEAWDPLAHTFKRSVILALSIFCTMAAASGDRATSSARFL